jgi:DNA repair exonuclease SbcCD nuclease subunit
MKYGVVSDIHAHAWSVYAHAGSTGVNSRLQLILDDLLRAADTLVAEGGKVLVIAGDIFHTRGAIDPEVLNPTRAVFDRILGMGIDIYAIPGNHDLKSNDSSELSSAIQNLAQISIQGAEFRVSNKVEALTIGGQRFGFVSWRHNHEALLADLERLAKDPARADMDVFIHAGIDGVLSGVPASGLTDAKLAAFGFRRIFSGHYHNHVVFPGSKVISIGATTHHNWGDVGTRAGFLIVDTDADTVTFHDTRAPKFIDLSGMDEVEMQVESKGAYVRFRGPAMTQTDINEFRDQLRKWGALGVSIEVPKVSVVTRTTTPAKGLTLEQSVAKFVTDTPPALVTAEEVAKRALEHLADAKVVYEDA